MSNEAKIKMLKQNGYKIYSHPQITFAIKYHNVIAMTNLQCFTLRINHPTQLAELEHIIKRIRTRKIRTPSDLVDSCNYRPNDDEYFTYFLGVELKATTFERALCTM